MACFRIHGDLGVGKQLAAPRDIRSAALHVQYPSGRWCRYARRQRRASAPPEETSGQKRRSPRAGRRCKRPGCGDRSANHAYASAAGAFSRHAAGCPAVTESVSRPVSGSRSISSLFALRPAIQPVSVEPGLGLVVHQVGGVASGAKTKLTPFNAVNSFQKHCRTHRPPGQPVP